MSAVPESFLGAAANDADAQETREWLDALQAVIASEGAERAHYLLERLIEEARQSGIDMPYSATTAYVNSIEPADEERSPGNLELEGRLRAYMRWNAMAMVVKANRLNPDDGGDLGGVVVERGLGLGARDQGSDESRRQEPAMRHVVPPRRPPLQRIDVGGKS